LHESQHHRPGDGAAPHKYARPHTTQREWAQRLQTSATAAALGGCDPGDNKIADCGKPHHSNSHHRLDLTRAASAPVLATANYTPSIFDSAIDPSALAAKTSLIIAGQQRFLPTPLLFLEYSDRDKHNYLHLKSTQL
jgi:hypothetical protein